MMINHCFWISFLSNPRNDNMVVACCHKMRQKWSRRIPFSHLTFAVGCCWHFPKKPFIFERRKSCPVNAFHPDLLIFRIGWRGQNMKHHHKVSFGSTLWPKWQAKRLLQQFADKFVTCQGPEAIFKCYGFNMFYYDSSKGFTMNGKF